MKKASQSKIDLTGKRVDLVLRVPGHIRVGRGPRFSIIEPHNQVAEKEGQVLFGKFGARVGANTSHKLEAGFQSSAPPRLIVVIKKGNFFGFSAELAGLGTEAPAPAERRFVPEFYDLLDELGERPSTWFRLASALEPFDLHSLSLMSSGRPLLDVISETRTTMMLVLSRHFSQE